MIKARSLHAVAVLAEDKVQWQPVLVSTYTGGLAKRENVGDTHPTLREAFAHALRIVERRRAAMMPVASPRRGRPGLQVGQIHKPCGTRLTTATLHKRPDGYRCRVCDRARQKKRRA